MEQTLEKRHGAKDVVASEVGVLSVVAMFYAICCAGAFGIVCLIVGIIVWLIGRRVE